MARTTIAICVCFETLAVRQRARGRSRPTARSAATRCGRRSCASKTPREADHRRGEGVRPARPRRRGLPDGREVELHAAQRRRCRSTSSATRTRASPAPATTATSCATTRTRSIEGMAHRRLRDGRDRRLQLHPRRVPRRAGAALRGSAQGSVRGRPARQEHAAAPASTSISTRSSARARTSAARRRRCSSRSRASRASRASSRRSRRTSACTARRRRSTTRRATPRCRRSCARARSGSPISASQNSGGTVIFSVSGHVEQARQLSSCRSAFRSPSCSRSAGGMRGGRKLKAVIPGGVVRAGRAGRR